MQVVAQLLLLVAVLTLQATVGLKEHLVILLAQAIVAPPVDLVDQAVATKFLSFA